MKRPNITPGPWKEDRKSHFCIVGNGGTFVSDMRPSAGTAGISTPRQEANARAIAALPDLLETLESIAHDFRCYDNAEHARDALTLAGYEF